MRARTHRRTPTTVLNLPERPDMSDTVALPSLGAAHTGADQAAGLRRLMARRVQAPAARVSPPLQPLRLGLVAQDAAMALWLREHLAVVNVQAMQMGASTSLAANAPVLLAIHAHAEALPQSLTWAYARLKRAAQQDAAQAPPRRLLPRVHVLLVGVAHAALGQQVLSNMSAAVQQHLGQPLPPGAWLCSAPDAASSTSAAAVASVAKTRAWIALDFCRLAEELRRWPAV